MKKRIEDLDRLSLHTVISFKVSVLTLVV